MTPAATTEQRWSHTDRAIKMAVDFTLTPLVLIASLPLLLVAAAWIRCVSPGPVLFRQRRIGKGEQPFQIFKLRTMRAASESHGHGSVTVCDDPRLIPGGRWIRALKIDELPQLLNVLNGAMSLVGPRPTVQEDYDKMTTEQRRRALVKPGITGLAQIRGGAGIPWPRRIEFDLQYIREYRPSLDLTILVETLLLTITGRADSNPAVADEWDTIQSPHKV